MNMNMYMCVYMCVCVYIDIDIDIYMYIKVSFVRVNTRVNPRVNPIPSPASLVYMFKEQKCDWDGPFVAFIPRPASLSLFLNKITVDTRQHLFSLLTPTPPLLSAFLVEKKTENSPLLTHICLNGKGVRANTLVRYLLVYIYICTYIYINIYIYVGIYTYI